jgi:hypothetical protein
VGAQSHALAALIPGKSRYPLYRGCEFTKSGLEGCGKISPLPGFDPCTVQPVASRYTDCAIPAHEWDSFSYEYFDFLLPLSFCNYSNSSNCHRSCTILGTTSLNKMSPESLQKTVCPILGVIRHINDFVLCKITRSVMNGLSVYPFWDMPFWTPTVKGTIPYKDSFLSTDWWDLRVNNFWCSNTCNRP